MPDESQGLRGPSRETAGRRLVAAVEWTCQTLWLAQRREPELVALQEERGSLGYPHYILSRAGNLPDRDWAAALYVMPEPLVEHLRARCLALDPPSYLVASQAAGSLALRRLAPGAGARVLAALARDADLEGPLARAWQTFEAAADPHSQLLWAAMTLREGRAFAHYQAARSADLDPIELLVLTATWRDGETSSLRRLFRWDDAQLEPGRAGLERRGWLNPEGSLTEVGRTERESLEAATSAHTDRLIAGLSGAELEELLAELPERS
ncbi:MAG: helix-turn-helix domain-containing protein [Candidatus Dormibacteria bacterium]